MFALLVVPSVPRTSMAKVVLLIKRNDMVELAVKLGDAGLS